MRNRFKRTVDTKLFDNEVSFFGKNGQVGWELQRSLASFGVLFVFLFKVENGVIKSNSLMDSGEMERGVA